jgi:hypothetical protein
MHSQHSIEILVGAFDPEFHKPFFITKLGGHGASKGFKYHIASTLPEQALCNFYPSLSFFT